MGHILAAAPADSRRVYVDFRTLILGAQTLVIARLTGEFISLRAHNRAHLINVGFCWPHKTTPKSAKYNWQPLRVSTISVIYNNKSVTVMHLNFVFIFLVHIYGGRWKRGVRFVTRTRGNECRKAFRMWWVTHDRRQNLLIDWFKKYFFKDIFTFTNLYKSLLLSARLKIYGWCLNYFASHWPSLGIDTNINMLFFFYFQVNKWYDDVCVVDWDLMLANYYVSKQKCSLQIGDN